MLAILRIASHSNHTIKTIKNDGTKNYSTWYYLPCVLLDSTVNYQSDINSNEIFRIAHLVIRHNRLLEKADTRDYFSTESRKL